MELGYCEAGEEVVLEAEEGSDYGWAVSTGFQKAA